MEEITALELAFTSARSQFDQSVGKAKLHRDSIGQLNDEIAKLSGDFLEYEKTLAVFHQLSQDVQRQFTGSIESLVTSGLQAVFGEEIQFSITPEVKGKLATLSFSVLTAQGEQADLVNSYGGGLVSVVGVILRVIVVRLMRRDVRQVLFLDEPLAMLSDEYIEPCARLLRKLSEDLDIQIIMVSHQQGFAEFSDVVYKVIRDSSKSASNVIPAAEVGV